MPMSASPSATALGMANDPIEFGRHSDPWRSLAQPSDHCRKQRPANTFDRGDRHMADASASQAFDVRSRPLEILQHYKDVAGHRLASRGQFDAAGKTLRTAARRPRLQASRIWRLTAEDATLRRRAASRIDPARRTASKYNRSCGMDAQEPILKRTTSGHAMSRQSVMRRQLNGSLG